MKQKGLKAGEGRARLSCQHSSHFTFKPKIYLLSFYSEAVCRRRTECATRANQERSYCGVAYMLVHSLCDRILIE